LIDVTQYDCMLFPATRADNLYIYLYA